MAKSKQAPPGTSRRMVWRISETHPQGEFVDANIVRPARPRDESEADTEFSSGGWTMSSFELLTGTDIVEGHDTVPADLFDELFPKPPSTPTDR